MSKHVCMRCRLGGAGKGVVLTLKSSVAQILSENQATNTQCFICFNVISSSSKKNVRERQKIRTPMYVLTNRAQMEDLKQLKIKV